MKEIFNEELKDLTKIGLEKMHKISESSEGVIDDVIAKVTNYFGVSIVENEELSYNKDYGKETDCKEENKGGQV